MLADIKGEATGDGLTRTTCFKYGVYRQMLADWFSEPRRVRRPRRRSLSWR